MLDPSEPSNRRNWLMAATTGSEAEVTQAIVPSVPTMKWRRFVSASSSEGRGVVGVLSPS